MHQIIYTSCRRGRDGASDGQQVYSYDQGFTESKNDEIKGIFGYQLPALPAGQVMTEELALTMPQAYFYRNLSRDRAVVSLNTYLGRDYMGSAGRFGNYLSHAFIGEREEFKAYPCEYLDGGSLRSSMTFEEVNLAETPPYLPAEMPQTGDKVSPDAVMELLSDEENMEQFKKMLHALLRFSKEKRRVLLCDAPDRVLLWIAALEYAFPLENAKSINFTTYSHDPELAAAQICGVLPEGTKYQPKKYVESGRFYVFDFINGVFTDVALEENEAELMEFFDTWFSIDYDTIRAFHRFLEENTSYRKTDESYLAAYQFYLLCTEGLEAVAPNAIAAVRAFMAEYADAEGKKLAIGELVKNETAVNDLSSGDAVQIYSLVTENAGGLDAKSREKVCEFLISQLMEHLAADDVTEEMFEELYRKLVGEASEKDIHILEELYRPENRERIRKAIDGRILPEWKFQWFIKVAAEHIRFDKIKAEQLGEGFQEGDFYAMLVVEAYNSGIPTGEYFVENLLKSLSDTEMFDHPEEYLLSAAMMLDEVLLAEVDEPNEGEYLWKCFARIYKDLSEFMQSWIRREMTTKEDYTCLSDMYVQLMAEDLSVVSFDEKQKQTREQYRILLKNEDYAKDYKEAIAGSYAQAYRNALPELSAQQREYALEVIQSACSIDGFVPELAEVLEGVLQEASLEAPGEQLAKAIHSVVKCGLLSKEERDENDGKIRGRMKLPQKAVLLELGNLLNKYAMRENKLSDHLLMLSKKRWTAGSLLLLSDKKEVAKYYKWALDPLFQVYHEKEIYEKIWYLLGFTESVQGVNEAADGFLEYATIELLNRAQKEKEPDYTAFKKFIAFVLDGTEHEQEVVGRCIGSRIKGKKLDAFSERFGMMMSNGNAWARMLDYAREGKESKFAINMFFGNG